MTQADEIPTLDTVGDLIALLKTVPATNKFRAAPGLVIIKKEDGTVLIDNGVIS